MTEIRESRKANGFVTLTLLASLLALFGWGAFAYQMSFSASAQEQLRQQVAELTQSRNSWPSGDKPRRNLVEPARS